MYGLKPQKRLAGKAAALAQAQNQAPDSIPGMFKPGEFVLPPDTVHAMGGKQALQGVVDSTHTPVNTQGQPTAGQELKAEQPEVFFNNGGGPEDQLPKSVVNPGNIFPQASPSAGANIYAGVGLSRDQFGSSGKFAQVPANIGQQPGRQIPVAPPAPVAPVAVQASSPAVPAAADIAPVAASVKASIPSPSNVFPGNRLQGSNGFSGAPVARPAATPELAAVDPSVELRRIADKNSRGERYGSDAPIMAAPAGLQAPRNPGASELYMQDRSKEMGDQWKAGNYAEAVGTAGRTAVQGLGMYGIEMADKAATPVGNAIGGFAKGLFGMSDAQAAPTTSSSAAATPAAPAPTAPAGYTHKSQGEMGPPNLSKLSGAATAPSTGTAPSAAPGVGQQGSLPTGVYNHGRGQYSDSAAGMGMPSGFTGQPSAQNMAAANALDSRQLSESMARVQAAQNQVNGGGVPASHRATILSGGAFGFKRDRRIEAADRGARADLRSQQRYDQKTMDSAAARQLEQARLGLEGARLNQASRSDAARLGLDSQRLHITQQQSNAELEGLGIKNRAAKHLEMLQEAYINAKTPEEQAAISGQIRAYSGKDVDSWKAVALQGGTDAAGNKTESMLGAVNERTGEMKRMGQGGPALPPGMSKQVGTSGGKPVYEDASGKRYVGG